MSVGPSRPTSYPPVRQPWEAVKPSRRPARRPN